MHTFHLLMTLFVYVFNGNIHQLPTSLYIYMCVLFCFPNNRTLIFYLQSNKVKIFLVAPLSWMMHEHLRLNDERIRRLNKLACNPTIIVPLNFNWKSLNGPLKMVQWKMDFHWDYLSTENGVVRKHILLCKIQNYLPHTLNAICCLFWVINSLFIWEFLFFFLYCHRSH